MYNPIQVKSLKKKLWRVFSTYIRQRDYGKGCISCDPKFLKRVPYGRQWHAGHYYTKGSTWATLYFDEQNVNGQCSHCNLYLEGNKQGYAKGLLRRYGPGILDILEMRKARTSHWGVFEYEAMIKKYQEAVKAL